MGHEIPERLRIPDYKEFSYEQMNKFPHLVKYRQELERQGLKDPWLRNVFWIYKCNPRFVDGKRNYFKNWGAISTGVLMATVIFGAYIVYDQTKQKMFGGGKEEHGHGHGTH